LSRPADQHLTQDELEFLISSGASQEWESSPSGLEPEGIVSHSAQCEKCRLLAASYAAVQARMGSLRSGRLSPRQVDCPSDEQWVFVAAGLLPAEQAEKNMQHAANCDHCGPLLRLAAEDFANELTPDEESLLAGLESGHDEWRKGLAGRLSNMKRDPGREAIAETHWWTLVYRPRLVFSAISVLLIGLAAWWFVWPQPHRTVDRLLAAAYSQRRTIALRIPGANYAPLKVERGTEQSRLDRPPELLEAEAIIARNLSKHPEDASWFQAKGRADLLEGDYDSAIKSFQRARETQSSSAPLLADLASAYFQRAEATDRAIDYANSIELLSEVLAREPDNQIALFNRAIVLERMTNYIAAVADWEHFLRLNPHGLWADEARTRLTSLQEMLKKHNQGLTRPLLAPEEFLAVLTEGSESARRDIDQRIEEYAEQSITQWLPEAFPAASASPELRAKRPSASAAQVLATLLNRKHQDKWLADLVDLAKSQRFPLAVRALSEAVKFNAAGDSATAEKLARQSETLFRLDGNKAGVWRARLEELYGLQFSMQGNRCLVMANRLGQQLQGQGYSWISAQDSLEEAICASLSKQFDTATQKAQQAFQVAEKCGYPVLELRSLGMLAAFDAEKGMLPEAWARNREGLVRYWAGVYPPIRAYQFYWDLSSVAHDMGDLRLSFLAAREAVQVISTTTHKSGEAMARYRTGQIALLVREKEQAQEQFKIAGELFSALPSNESTELFRLDTRIALAELASEQDKLDAPLAELDAIAPEIPKLSNLAVPLRYYQTLGSLRLRRGENEEAAKDFEVAACIGKKGLTALKGDYGRLKWKLEMQSVYRSLVDLRLRAGDPQGALDYWEWYRGAELLEVGSPRTPKLGTALPHSAEIESCGENDAKQPVAISGRALQARSDRTVLSYIELERRVVVWAFDDGGVEAHQLDVTPSELRAEANRFLRLCSDPNSDLNALRTSSRRLYDWLIGSVRPRFQVGRTLVIESDDSISSIPMQALLDADGHYLGDLFPIVMSLGLTYEQRLRSEAFPTAFGHVLVVGEPTVSGDLARGLFSLQDATREAESVARRFDSATLLVGRLATLERVEKELPRSDLLHFAGHAISTSRVGGLLLASADADSAETSINPAVLDVEQLKPVALNRCRLAVLSACATAKGFEETLYDPNNLVRGFLLGRVPHVVASRWNVDSKTTATLMDAFYTNLLSGKTVPQSMQVAERAIRQQSPTAHPYYWSAFSTFGRL
jgi:CHAT domain-containing protein/cytochrome c-type biogenesis protein CcmH/NrfG